MTVNVSIVKLVSPEGSQKASLSAEFGLSTNFPTKQSTLPIASAATQPSGFNATSLDPRTINALV